MKRLYLLYNYLIYSIKSVNQHGVHSPFVFDLLTGTIYNRENFYAYKELERMRTEMLLSDKKIQCLDFGAGSLVQKKGSKKLKQIVLSAAKSPKYAQLLFRLTDHFQPSVIIELGTSAGISTAYMASASSRAKLITIEGCPEIAEIAEQNFKKLGLSNIKQLIGNFDEILPEVLKDTEKLDLVFFDGNHRKEPTLNYFKQCLEKAVDKSIFIFDDIYWSAEMKEAWEEIKKDEKVTVTLDLFYFGIVFFRKEQAKEHFMIRY